MLLKQSKMLHTHNIHKYILNSTSKQSWILFLISAILLPIQEKYKNPVVSSSFLQWLVYISSKLKFPKIIINFSSGYRYKAFPIGTTFLITCFFCCFQSNLSYIILIHWTTKKKMFSPDAKGHWQLLKV